MPTGVPLDLVSKIFGRLTVLSKLKADGCSLWRCICDCGIELDVQGGNLISDQSQSCGCYKRDMHVTSITKHGHSRVGKVSTEYRSWQAMKRRCLNAKDSKYDYYGGRGITVCLRWVDSFENFIYDMGNKPTKAHTLDRVNVNGNYGPDNCKWATRKEQRTNQRKHALLENFTTEELVSELTKREAVV